jgi:hypothetical protein
VTQQDVANQSTQPFQVGFCFNPFACFGCPNDAVNPGDIVCAPACVCAPLPPICGSDAGTDAPDDAAPDAPDDSGLDASVPDASSDGGPIAVDAATP